MGGLQGNDNMLLRWSMWIGRRLGSGGNVVKQRCLRKGNVCAG